jgi:arylsulfate sulfotransferase
MTFQPCAHGAVARSRLLHSGLVAAILWLSGCGGGESAPPSGPLTFAGALQGVTPFIYNVQLFGQRVRDLATVRYTIAPRPGAASRPVSVSYAVDALSRRGYVNFSGGLLTLPVFGLYAGYANQVSIELTFVDTSTQPLAIELDTAPYVDPNGIYDRPQVLKARAPGDALGFDYLALKNMLGGPVVIDTDGALRWVGPAIGNSTSTVFSANGFEIGSPDSAALARVELDGTVSQTALDETDYVDFHHNVDAGKAGLLVEVDSVVNGSKQLESTLAEVTLGGATLREWDMAAILSDYMRSRGDDPGAFVRPGVDWFHMNTATYDPRDDTVIVSSRENFLVKLDYKSGNIVWIFGDPTKYWYTFASLREKAVLLPAGDLYPIGQHAISINAAGELMLFNNGLPSLNQPAGAAAGESRSYSAVSAYAIDAGSLTAHEVWRFDHDRSVLSEICSSAYEAEDGASLLVNYAVADNRTHARVVGLDADHNPVFDLEYPTTSCNTSWNAIPVPLQNMAIQ